LILLAPSVCVITAQNDKFIISKAGQ